MLIRAACSLLSPFPPCNPGMKIKLTRGAVLLNACLTSPVTCIPLPLGCPYDGCSGYGNLCAGAGSAGRYKSLVSQRLDSPRLTCPKQCGKTTNKSFVFPKVQEPRGVCWVFFLFPFLPGAALFSLEELHAIACCKIVLIFYLPTPIVTRTQSGMETPFEGVYW